MVENKDGAVYRIGTMMYRKDDATHDTRLDISEYDSMATSIMRLHSLTVVHRGDNS